MGLKADYQAVRQRAGELLKAGGERDLSAEEIDEAFQLGQKAQSLREQLEASERSAEQLRSIQALSAPEAKALNDGALSGPPALRSRYPSAGLEFIASPVYQEFRKRFPGNHIPDGASINTPPAQIKGGLWPRRKQGDGIPEGTLMVRGDEELQALIPEHDLGVLPEPPLWQATITGLITQGTTTSDLIVYARMLADVTGEQNQAGFVLEGEIKPQSTFSFMREQAPVVTLAHWIAASKIALADIGQLRTMIDNFLIEGLRYRVEQQILSGDGSDGGLTGILNTAGIQSAAGDLVTAIRRAITLVTEIPASSPPNAVVLNPLDDEALDLMTDDIGRFFGAGPFQTGPRTIWGLPRVTTQAMPEGQALVGDFRQAVLWNRQQDTISFSDSHADFFIRNLVVVLGERRMAFGVLRPQAFCLAGGEGGNGETRGAAQPRRGRPSGRASGGGGTTGTQAPAGNQQAKREGSNPQS